MFTVSACDATNWKDLDKGVVCGPCKGLVRNMMHRSCNNFCNTIGRRCVGAWEERNEDCQLKSTESCDHIFSYTSDAICECEDNLYRKSLNRS